MKKILTQDLLKNVVSYNADSGLFTRTKQTCGKVKVGSVISHKNPNGYISFRVDGVLQLAHRMAWLYEYGELPTGQIDHINGIRDDNRLCNIRIASSSQNQQNRRKARKDNIASCHIGVGFKSQNKKWRARIQIENKSVWLGYFDSEHEAVEAYKQAKTNLHPYAPAQEMAVTA